MKVAITVKTYPSPSTEYLETVCVAGVRLDTEKPEWVRLYPVPFRFLRDDQRFIKYEVIELDANTHVRDKRPESRRPVLDSIRTVGHLLPTTAGFNGRRLSVHSLVQQQHATSGPA